MKHIVFVSGVARSGTTALVRVLNKHPGFVVGMERYFYPIRRRQITHDYFARERFLDVQPEDTYNTSLSTAHKGEAYDRATFVGDKYPMLFERFDYILETFPEARQIYIARNPLSVAESYEARRTDTEDGWKRSWEDGLAEWNASLKAVMSLSEETLQRFYFIQYEEFFGSPLAMNRLYEAFGLHSLREQALQPFCDKFETLNSSHIPRRDDIRQHVARYADWSSYHALLDRIDAQNGAA